jgi:tRNA(fMet)-specific endonuclease VapC
MILADTSAWIDFFRGREPMASSVESYLLDNQVALCGPVLTELLRGLKSKRERETVLPLLDGCHYLSQPDRLWEDAGNCGYQLARQGKSVKSMDLLVACYALAHKTAVLTLDRDFLQIKRAGFDLEILTGDE